LLIRQEMSGTVALAGLQRKAQRPCSNAGNGAAAKRRKHEFGR
jgi:hypothetical protein